MWFKDEVQNNFTVGCMTYRNVLCKIQDLKFDKESSFLLKLEQIRLEINDAIMMFNKVNAAVQNRIPETDFDEYQRFYWFDISRAMIYSLDHLKNAFQSNDLNTVIGMYVRSLIK